MDFPYVSKIVDHTKCSEQPDVVPRRLGRSFNKTFADLFRWFKSRIYAYLYYRRSFGF